MARAVVWCDERVIKWEVLARVVESERSIVIVKVELVLVGSWELGGWF